MIHNKQPLLYIGLPFWNPHLRLVRYYSYWLVTICVVTHTQTKLHAFTCVYGKLRVKQFAILGKRWKRLCPQIDVLPCPPEKETHKSSQQHDHSPDSVKLALQTLVVPGQKLQVQKVDKQWREIYIIISQSKQNHQHNIQKCRNLGSVGIPVFDSANQLGINAGPSVDSKWHAGAPWVRLFGLGFLPKS